MNILYVFLSAIHYIIIIIIIIIIQNKIICEVTENYFNELM